jgi:hypothetical protein
LKALAGLFGLILLLAAPPPISWAQFDSQIQGVVWHDENGDGKRQPDEPAASPTPLILKSPHSSTFKRTVSAEDGHYVFPGLAVGSYTIEIDVGPEFLRYATSPSRVLEGVLRIDFTVTDVSSSLEVDIGIYPGGRVPIFEGVAGGGAHSPVVQALVAGQVCSLLDPLRPPHAAPDYYRIVVLPDSLVPGCGSQGKSIMFTVNGSPAEQMAIWSEPRPGQLVTTLDLSTAGMIRPPATGDGALKGLVAIVAH